MDIIVTYIVPDSALFRLLRVIFKVYYLIAFLQVVVEKKIMRERKQTRHDVGREKFVSEVSLSCH